MNSANSVAMQHYVVMIRKTASGCFAVLHRIKSIWRFVSPSLLQLLIISLVLSRLDYGCNMLAGLPRQLLDRLQSVQNATACLVFSACRHDHVTLLLCSPHWLPVAERITFQLAVLAASMVQCWSTYHCCCTSLMFIPINNLKIKCNVFSYVEVNFSTSVFNINKSIWVLRKITKITNLLIKTF